MFIENSLFVSKSLNNQFPEICNNWFVFSFDTNRYETSLSEKCMLKLKSRDTKLYGKEAITRSTTNTWNKTFKNN